MEFETALAFLDAHFKNDPSAHAFLGTTPETQGVPARMFLMMHRASQGPALSLQDFAQHLNKAGFDHSITIYADYHHAHPDFSLMPDQLEPWVSALIHRHDFQHALGLA